MIDKNLTETFSARKALKNTNSWKEKNFQFPENVFLSIEIRTK